ncbi:uncharacterized protein LOC141614515 [Silene latifolia]|uniref:uncharacterized protein LOC141614515 n=1 Tax=Silene latifolia TaxID=37657 RepID=UPI003D780EFF
MPTIASHLDPTVDSLPKGFLFSTSDTGAFGIHPSYIQLVERNQFRGVKGEDPIRHVELFTDYCSTVPLTAGVTQDKVKEFLFTFSLTGEAREWLRDLDREVSKIADWSTFALAFYMKYFPPQRTYALRSQITNFTQLDDEDLHQAWTRFKKLVCSIPHHGFQRWYLCNQFYNGLYNDQRSVLDVAANGGFSKNVDDDKGWQLIDQMATHVFEYGSPRSTRTEAKESVQQVFFLNIQEEVCGRCGDVGHGPVDCLASNEQVIEFRQAKKRVPSCEVVQNASNLHSNPAPQQVISSSNAEMEELKNMFKIMVTRCAENERRVDMLVSKLYAQEKENSPDPVNTINLRSGLSYDGPDLVKKNAETDTSESPGTVHAGTVQETSSAAVPELDREGYMPRSSNYAEFPFDRTPSLVRSSNYAEDPLDRKPMNSAVPQNPLGSVNNPTDNPSIQVPFPSRLQDKKLEKDFGKFVEMLRMLNVTVPFTELLTQVPSYRKFMKEILIRRRHINDYETVALTEEGSALLQNRTSSKRFDPGSFSIPCYLGNYLIDNALCDLGAGVSVLPLSLAMK